MLVFGNPTAGTPLMQADPRSGLDLPLQVLVWATPDGTRVGFRDPAVLAILVAIVQERAPPPGEARLPAVRLRDELGLLVVATPA